LNIIKIMKKLNFKQGLIGIVAGALIATNIGCTAQNEYETNCFNKILNERNLDEKQKAKSIEFLNESDEFRKFLCDVYTNPEKMYDKLPDDEKKDFDKYFKDFDMDKLNKYKKSMPWINTKEKNLSDVIMIYVCQSLVTP